MDFNLQNQLSLNIYIGIINLKSSIPTILCYSMKLMAFQLSVWFANYIVWQYVIGCNEQIIAVLSPFINITDTIDLDYSYS